MAAHIRTVAAFKASFFAYLERGGFVKFSPTAGLVEFHGYAREHFLDLQEYEWVTKSAFPADRTLDAWRREYAISARIAQIKAADAARAAEAATAKVETTTPAAPVVVPVSSPLRAYAFGTGLYAGIACLTGEAGVDIDTTLTFEDFRDVIKSYLDEEDDVDSELLAEFADTELVATLYAEWREGLDADDKPAAEAFAA